MQSVENPLNAKPLGRQDGRTAFLVHGLGWLAAGVPVVLAFVFKMAEKDALPVLGVGLAAYAVAVLWSLALVWRGFRQGGSLGAAVWLSWIVLTEAALGLGLLWLSELRNWTSFSLAPEVSFVLRAGGPVWIAMFWICATVTLPFAWWWMRWEERRAATIEPTTSQAPRLRWRRLWRRLLPLMALPVLFSLPIALVLNATTSESNGLAPEWLIRNTPAIMQDAALAIRFQLVPDSRAGWYLGGLEYLDDQVLIREMERRGGNCGADYVLALRRSNALLVWVKEKVAAGTYTPATGNAIQRIASDGPIEVIRELLATATQSSIAYPGLNDVVRGLRYRTLWKTEDELHSLLPELLQLRGSPVVQQPVLTVLLSDASRAEDRCKFWEAETGYTAGKGPPPPLGPLSDIRYTAGVEPFLKELLDDPQALTRRAALNACVTNRRLLNALLESAQTRFLELTQDPDLWTRRYATALLARKLGIRIRLDSPWWVRPSQLEDAQELAERAKVVEAARALMEKTPAGKAVPSKAR